MFLNPDDEDYLGLAETPETANMFAYCSNDPINFSDYDGNWKREHHMIITQRALSDIFGRIFNYASKKSIFSYVSKTWKSRIKKLQKNLDKLFMNKELVSYDYDNNWMCISPSLYDKFNESVKKSKLLKKSSPIMKKDLSLFLKSSFISGVFAGCVYPDEVRKKNDEYELDTGWHGRYKKYDGDGIKVLYKKLLDSKSKAIQNQFSILRKKENEKLSSRRYSVYINDVYYLGRLFGSVLHAVQDDDAHRYSKTHNSEKPDYDHPDDISYYVKGNKLIKGTYDEDTMFKNNRIKNSLEQSVKYFKKSFKI